MMGTLSSCALKFNQVLPEDDLQRLKAFREKHEGFGLSPDAAQVEALNDLEKEYVQFRAGIEKQITEAGGVAPALPEPPVPDLDLVGQTAEELNRPAPEPAPEPATSGDMADANVGGLFDPQEGLGLDRPEQPFEEANRKKDEAAAKAKAESAETAAAQPKTPSPKKASRSAEKIEDFGEEIGGARKHLAAMNKALEELEGMSDEDVFKKPLSKLFPDPNYIKLIEEEGVSVKDAALIKALRSLVPSSKPRRYGSKAWVDKVRMIAGLASKIITGDVTYDQIIEKMVQPVGDQAEQSMQRIYPRMAARGVSGRNQYANLKEQIESRVELDLEMGFPNSPKSLHQWYIERVEWNWSDGKPLPKGEEVVKFYPKKRTKGRGGLMRGGFDSREDAVESLKASLKTGQARGKIKFQVWREAGKITVGKKVAARKFITLKDGFSKASEAFAYIAENQKELEAQLAEKKKVAPHRKESNDPRIGGEYRNGKDADAESFSKAFGFRGVQFGNYVEQKKRQNDLNEAYDALMDLANLLDIPPKAISLNGELGLAFGARGRGGKNAAAAHYESDRVVINLTKHGGAGSLAHEWFHSLDSYFSRMRGRSGDFATNRPRPLLKTDGSKDDSVRPEVLEALKGVLDAIDSTDLKARSGVRDNVRTKDYWGTTIEMAARTFENYVITKAEEKGMANDYLANVVPEPKGDELAEYPYLTADEIQVVSDAYDNLFQVIESRETDQGVELYSKGPPAEKGATQPQFETAIKRALGPRAMQMMDTSFVDKPSDLGGRRPADILAVTRPDGTVTFVLSNIPEYGAVSVFSHEAVHAVVWPELEASGFLDKVVADLQRLKKTNKAVQKAYAQIPKKTKAAHRDEEALAYLVQNNPKMTIVQRLVNAIKRALRAMGIKGSWIADNTDEIRQTVVDTIKRRARGRPSVQRGNIPAPGLYTAAFHGSPHDFEEFTTDAIGTGEGNQAYGWGMYFADRKDVAEWYKRNLTDESPTFDALDDNQNVAIPGWASHKIATAVTGEPRQLEILRRIRDFEGRIDDGERSLKDDPMQPWIIESTIKGQKETLDALKSLRDAPNQDAVFPSGKGYQVDLKPKEDEYLLLDEPIGKQPWFPKEGPKEAAARYKREGKPADAAAKLISLAHANANQSGRGFYQDLAQKHGSDQAASEWLLSVGVRGNKFLDRITRNRPLKAIKQAFLTALPEDAEFEDVLSLVGTGEFTSEQDRVLTALEENDWLGFDYPAQAINAAFRDVSAHDPSPELVDAISELKKDPTYNYVIFSDDDVSVTDKFARAPAEPSADPFYSQLNRTAEAKLPGKGTGASFAQALEAFVRKGEIKQEELDWSGVIEFLAEVDGVDEGGNRITKAEVMEYLRENEVRVEEKVSGESVDEDRMARLWFKYQRDMGFDAAKERMDKEFGPGWQETSNMPDPKFAEWQTPGGENYRELLLTLPPREAKREQYKVVPPVDPDGNVFDRSWTVESADGTLMDRSPLGASRTGEQWAITRAQYYSDQSAKYSGDDYTGGHYDEPNVLAHIRFNERTDADGNRVLFVEEVQSDWHQAGRKEGYQSSETTSEAWSAKRFEFRDSARTAREQRYDVFDSQGNTVSRQLLASSEQDAIDKAFKGSGREGIPDAPFKTTIKGSGSSLSGWAGLSMKRMIRYAAENGFDKLAWTSGEMQADRYDLSKHVKRINYTVETGRLTSVDHQGSSVISEDNVSPERLADFIGKEAADKIINNPTSKDYGINSLVDDDLRIGGQGMRVFYDKMLPSAINKYVKKWGAKVGETNIGDEVARLTPPVVLFTMDALDKWRGIVSAQPEVSLQDHWYSMTAEEQDSMLEIGGKEEWANQQARMKEQTERGLVPSIPITPAMKESTLEGQARFARGKIDDNRNKVVEAVKKGQPLDRIFRLLFQMLGGLDSHGRWRKGTKAYGRLVKLVTETKFDDESSAGSFFNPWLEKARASVIDRYGLSDEYKKADNRRKLHETLKLREGQEVLKKLVDHGVDLREAQVLQSVLTGERIAGPAWESISEPIRRAIAEMGQEAVMLGLISQEAYDRNAGAYLHRSYLKHEGDMHGLVGAMNNMLTKRRKAIVGNELKARGIDLPVNLKRLPGELAEGDKVIQYRNPDTRRRVYRKPGESAPEGYEQTGEWTVRSTNKKQGFLWRDYTKAERERMGEILDARYNIAKTYQLLASDLATGKFLKTISENDNWARDDEPEGTIGTAREGISRTFSDFEWIKVPDSIIPKTGKRGKGKSNDGEWTGAKRWGALSGMYVRSEIWRDLNQLNEMQHSGTWSKMLTMWKLNKTARNPVVHMNNVVSNFLLADMVDIRFRDIARALSSFKAKDQDYEDAEVHGVFGNTFLHAEIRRNVLDPILQEIKGQASNDDTVVGAVALMNKITTGTWNWLKKADKKLLDTYQAEDEIFRLATYMHRKELGDSTEEAAAAARAQFIDYDIHAPGINALRQSVLPFLSYTYRAVPVVAKAIAERPWKLAKYSTIAYAVNMLAYMISGGDEDEDRRTMREEVQGDTWVGTSRMVRMPYRDRNDDPVFLDVRRFIPVGDIQDMNQNELPIPAPLQFGGPIMLAGELMLNKAAFTKQEIFNKDADNPGEITGKVATHLYRSWMPSAPWIPNSWYWNKIDRAMTGGRDSLMREYSVPQALLSSVGIKVTSHNPALGEEMRLRDISRTMGDIKWALKRLQKDRARGLINEAEFTAAYKRKFKKIEKLEAAARKVTGQEG